MKPVIKLAIVLVVVLPGCGPAKTDNGYVPIIGMVRVDGMPAEGVVITLHAASGEPPISTGISGADGRLTISTNTLGDGALPGRYTVTCTWGEFDPVGRSWKGDRLGGQYASPETSGIAWDILDGESHDVGTLELKAKP